MEDVTYRFLEKPKYPDGLQEIVQVIVKCGWWIYAIDVGV